jgi:hypothetical protein
LDEIVFELDFVLSSLIESVSRDGSDVSVVCYKIDVM